MKNIKVNMKIHYDDKDFPKPDDAKNYIQMLLEELCKKSEGENNIPIILELEWR